MPRKVWNDVASWQTRRLNNSTKYPLHASMTTTSKKKKWNLLENCHKYALKLFWNAYTWHELEDLIFYGQWTNLHDRSQKWTKACDKRLGRLISYIHHTCKHKQYCHVGNTAKQCRLGLFQDSDFAGDLEDSKSTSGGTLCIFGSHTFVPISWMCKKQTAVSHSSTESENISLDIGLRLDGLPALELWDLIVSFFGSVSQISDRTGNLLMMWRNIIKSQGKINVMENIDSVHSNVQSLRQEALLYVFEDNEAVIKIIKKGKKSCIETCFQDSQSCTWLVVWSN